MSAQIESLPIPSTTGFGPKARWAAIALALIVLAVLGSMWAFGGTSEKAPTKAPAKAPAVQIQAPGYTGGSSGGGTGTAGCGLIVRGGPC
jgi:hypothetical protein